MTWKKALLLFIVLGGLISASYAWRSATDSPTVAGRAAVSAAEVDRLIGVFEQRLQASSNPTDAGFLGRLFLQRFQLNQSLSDLEAAHRHLTVAVAAYPDTATLTDLAQADLGLHNFRQAAQTSADVISVDPASSGARSVLVDAQLALGEYDAVEANLDYLARQLPDDPSVLIRRAQLLFLTGQGAEAAVQAEAAVAGATALSAPERAFYHLQAGRLWFEQGQYEEARSKLEVGLGLDPRNPGIHLELARTLAALGQFEQAQIEAQAAVDLVPEPGALALLGDIMTINGNPEEAEALYQTVAAIAQLGQIPYRRPIASALAEVGREPELVLDLSAAEIDERQDPTTWDVRAMALLAAGRVDEANAAIARALGPADARIWYHAGLIAFESGDRPGAISYLEQALDLNPRFHPLFATRAASLLEQLGAGR